MIYRPTGFCSAELVVKRSRFIAEAGPIVSRETAEARIAEARSAHADATHVVYAFAFGAEKSLQYGMSDDGEPKNTAGRPVLEVLKGNELTDCIVTVTRYYGGTKLGTGGLVHAYGNAAKMVVKDLPRERRINRFHGTITISYNRYQVVRQLIDSVEGVVEDEKFESEISIQCAIPESLFARFREEAADLSRGEAHLSVFHVKQL